MPAVKVRGNTHRDDCESEMQALERSLDRLKRAMSHHLRDEKSELFALRRELKDSASLVATLRGQLAKQELETQELAKLLSEERTANVRLSREHEDAVERLGSELQAAKLILGNALGAEPEAPRNSLVVKKPGAGQNRKRRTADTVRPKAACKN